MDLNLISGLLLAGTVLLGVGYIVKTLFFAPQSAAPARDAAGAGGQTARPAADPSAHLVGAAGEVVGSGGDGLMRVRIGLERWSAVSTLEGAAPLPAGTGVRVTAVVGHVLHVEPDAPAPPEESGAADAASDGDRRSPG